MSKGLGRGLEGLFEDNAPLIDKIDEKQLLFVKISDVEPNRDQPRKAFDKQALEELSASVADRGLLQPIIARKIDGDRYQIVSGERRWRAARMAGLTEVPVIVKDLSDKEALEIGLIENLQRENLNVVEEAKGYKALIDEFSLTQEQVAEKVGKSRPAVANAMRILALPDETLDLVLDGKLSSGHARALLPLAERAERVRNGMVDARVDNMLKITNDGRKLALDQRLINPLLPDFEDSKLNACVDAMFETWERGSEKRLTQLFFCDLSTPKNDGSFNVYDEKSH